MHCEKGLHGTERERQNGIGRGQKKKGAGDAEDFYELKNT